MRLIVDVRRRVVFVESSVVHTSFLNSVRMAIDAGIDMSMVPNNYEFCDLLIELVKEGTISEERLDVSVRRILTLKKKLGLFENPMPLADAQYQAFGAESSKLISQATAEESITLLKNNKVLPVNTQTKILVTGPAADSYIMLNGAWTRTWQGTDTKWDDPTVASIFDAMKSIGGNQIQYVEAAQQMTSPMHGRPWKLQNRWM